MYILYRVHMIESFQFYLLLLSLLAPLLLFLILSQRPNHVWVCLLEKRSNFGTDLMRMPTMLRHVVPQIEAQTTVMRYDVKKSGSLAYF